MNDTALFAAVFLACIVEAVEATTIVVAAGATRNWRSALTGSVVALFVLAVAVAIAGPAITLLPLGVLRIAVGGLLFVFGLQWIRKAVLRASGYKALHDEDAIYRKQVAAAQAADHSSRFGVRDWYAFTLSFKGVLLEGLEVVFIVLTFGTNQGNLPLAALAALIAVVIVIVLGAAVRGPLSRVPENTLKFIVGIMLTSFGAFWGAEGAGAAWPGSDASLLVLVPSVAAFSLVLVVLMRVRRNAVSRRRSGDGPSEKLAGPAEGAIPETVLTGVRNAVVSHPADGTGPAAMSAAASPKAPGGSAEATAARVGASARRGRPVAERFKAFGLFWYDFVIGDDWQIAAGVALALIAVALLSAHAAAWVVVPCAIAVLIPYGVWRANRR
jgi:uncharacterized membrane protein